jgi:hypothetical protein
MAFHLYTGGGMMMSPYSCKPTGGANALRGTRFQMTGR